MRLRIVALLSCLVGLGLLVAGWPATAGAQTTTTVPSTTSTSPTTTVPPPPPAPPTPPPPTQEQIDAFLRALVPPNSGHGRRIIYSNSWQRVWLVDDQDRLVKSYLVSGRRGVPHAGVYRVYSKSRYASSGSARMEFMVRFARGRSLAIGFHSIPYVGRRPLQSVFQLGTFRSHGCVRQWILDAAYLYMWAPLGTVVVVFP
jgi:lipoprotein-anchoring transpeptidase ErfK/SrfK